MAENARLGYRVILGLETYPHRRRHLCVKEKRGLNGYLVCKVPLSYRIFYSRETSFEANQVIDAANLGKNMCFRDIMPRISSASDGLAFLPRVRSRKYRLALMVWRQ